MSKRLAKILEKIAADFNRSMWTIPDAKGDFETPENPQGRLLFNEYTNVGGHTIYSNDLPLGKGLTDIYAPAPTPEEVARYNRQRKERLTRPTNSEEFHFMDVPHALSNRMVKTRMANIGAKPDNRGGYTIPGPSQYEIASARIGRLYRQSPLKEMTPHNAEIWARRNENDPAARAHQRIMSQIAEVRQGLKETGKNQPLKPAYKPSGGSPLTQQGKVVDKTKEHPGQWYPQLPGIND